MVTKNILPEFPWLGSFLEASKAQQGGTERAIASKNEPNHGNSGRATKKRKIAIVTGTRAEYGLLFYLMREIQDDSDLELQVIATGMHLSPEFGMTYKLIEADGFHIDAKIEILMSSDSAVGVTKSMGLALISFADALSRLAPDVLILLGDRFESLAAAQASLLQKIPLAHIHGGELSAGAIDDAMRHAITKMSHLHFVAAEPYRKRVIQLGENPKNVFNVGALGLERIMCMQLLNRPELEKKINFQLGQLNFLVTYHSATLQIKENTHTLDALFDALDHFPDARIIFTKANADEEGRMINSKIDAYVSRNAKKSISFFTLGDLQYLSLLQFVDAVIGNSSSGLIEVPYFRKPTINIGNRQMNRLKATSVIDCESHSENIIHAIKKSLSDDFKEILKNTESPYTQDKTANRIKTIIKNVDLNQLVVKIFNDI